MPHAPLTPDAPPVAAVDLCCGAGGLTRGLLDAGIRVVAGYDLDPACRYPYEHNNHVPFVRQDLHMLDPAAVARRFPAGAVRLIAGGAPCQPYSTYSRGRKRNYAPHRHLLGACQRLILAVRPELVVLENVVPVRRHPSYIALARSLLAAGYYWTEHVVRCAAYGVPQTRTRLVLIASRFAPVWLTPPADAWRHATVRAAIGHLPPLAAGATDPQDRLHTAARLSPLNLQRIRASRPGGTWQDWDPALVAACHQTPAGRSYTAVYGRMAWDAPAPTITTQFFRLGTGRFGHPEQDRALSLREGALLQTFPPTYAFVPPAAPVSLERVGRLIGNAVPVRLAQAIGHALLRHVAWHAGAARPTGTARLH